MKKIVLFLIILAVCAPAIHAMSLITGKPSTNTEKAKYCTWNTVKFELPYPDMEEKENTQQHLLVEGMHPSSTLEANVVENAAPKAIATRLLEELEQHYQVTVQIAQDVTLQDIKGYIIHGHYTDEAGYTSFFLLGTSSALVFNGKPVTLCTAGTLLVKEAAEDTHTEDGNCENHEEDKHLFH